MKDTSHDIIEFTLVYNNHKTKVFNYLLKMINDRMAVEDIMQDVFLKLFENLQSIKNKNSISFWIFTTARNEVFGYFRKKKIKVDQFNVDDSEDIEIEVENDLLEKLEHEEIKEFILKELNNIQFEQREIFLLKEYGGLSYKEIAAVMSIDEELVKSRLHKAREKIIQKLSRFVNE